MTATLRYTVRNCVRGWSGYFTPEIDVRTVMTINYHERMFCLFDRDHPWTVYMKIYNPRSESSVAPVIAGGRFGIAFTNEYRESSMMTLRFQTEKHATDMINEIERMKKFIADFDNKEQEKLNEFIKNK